MNCPRCEQTKQVYPEIRVNLLVHPVHRNALSRTDNETYICSTCGMVEALVDFSDEQFEDLRAAAEGIRV